MGYLQALNLLIRTYKATKGYLPKGIDMLKLKMKARQKVIDSKKVIKFPQGGKDKINPFKPRPTKPEGIIPVTVKGKTTKMTPEGIMKMLTGKGKDVKLGQAPKTTKRKPAVDPKLTQEENIKRIMAENKAAAKRLQEKMNKPEKTLGEKLKDYKGDPDAMKDGGKVKKKRKHNDNVDDEDIGEGESKERFLRVMPEVDGIPRSDGIMELAVGGMTNIGDTYDNNPTLQSQYPNKQDYLDLFAQQTTTTTPQYATTYQSTGSIDPINPIKPIIPIPQYSNDGGEGITFGRTNMNQPNAMGGKTPGIKAGAQRAFNDIKTAAGGLYNVAKIFNPLDPEKLNIMNLYKMGKEAFSKRGDRIAKEQIAKAIALEEEMRRREEDRIRSQSPSGSMNYGPSGYEGMSDAASDQERSEGGRGSRG